MKPPNPLDSRKTKQPQTLPPPAQVYQPTMTLSSCDVTVAEFKLIAAVVASTRRAGFGSSVRLSVSEQ